jgi:hypothetical protein
MVTISSGLAPHCFVHGAGCSPKPNIFMAAVGGQSLKLSSNFTGLRLSRGSMKVLTGVVYQLVIQSLDYLVL